MNAVSVIAEVVATIPCYLYLVRNDKGREAREWLDSHPVDILLNEQPNSCQTPYQFKRTMMRHCLLNGNAYAVIEWGRTDPKSLHPYALRVCCTGTQAHTNTAIPSPNLVQERCARIYRKKFCTSPYSRMMAFWGVPRHDLP